LISCELQRAVFGTPVVNIARGRKNVLDEALATHSVLVATNFIPP